MYACMSLHQCLVVMAVHHLEVCRSFSQSLKEKDKIKTKDLHTHPAMLFSVFYFISPASNDLDDTSRVLYVLNSLKELTRRHDSFCFMVVGVVTHDVIHSQLSN